MEVYLSSRTSKLVKLLDNFSNAKTHDFHGFKEEIKVKYEAILAVVGKFPNRTSPMMVLLI